ncbi:hypothetical protein MSPP1_001648 [Malassezia sp. CBS 17886]|nr:hypothetical protein MSPP1_001648 [Malassezia sp. CBS 17886]
MPRDASAHHARPRSSPATRAGGADDITGWSSSLYSANTGRDASAVSSYYLRQQAAEGESGDDSVSGVYSGLGSLLRGSQRPPQTPRSFLRHTAAAPLADQSGEYAEEDEFMQRVESGWRGHTAESWAERDADEQDGSDDAMSDSQRARSVPMADAASASGGPTRPSLRTPRVPGFFSSPWKKVRAAAAEADPRDADPAAAPAFSDGHEQPRAETVERADPWSTRALLYAGAALFLLLGAYYLLSGRASFAAFPADDTPPLPSAKWHALGSDEALGGRVHAVEQAVETLWHSVDGLGRDVKSTHMRLAQRLGMLEARPSVDPSVRALQVDVRALQRQQAESVRAWEDEKRALEGVAARVSQEKTTERGSATALDGMQSTMSALEAQIARATRGADAAEKMAQEAKHVMGPLLKRLPTHLPVHFDEHSQQLRIDPAFWRELRRVFIARDGAQGEGDDGAGNGAGWEENRATPPPVEAAVERYLATRVDGAGVLLSRSAFVDLLEAEMARAKEELTVRFNDNAQDLQNSILAKVRQQQDMYERSGSWERHGQAWDAPAAASSEGATSALIAAALARFAADQIARADFAQYSAGGRVVPALTSPTHELRLGGRDVLSVRSVLGSILPLPQWTGSNAGAGYTVRGRAPVVALHHDNAPGMCWPFSGTHGQLGIQLVRKIHVAAITIDHIPASLALDGLGSAPRDMEAWGIVDTDADRAKLAQWRRRMQAARRTSEWGGEAEVAPTPVPPTPSHVYLGAFTYEAGGGMPPIQTFPVASEAAAAGVPFRVVQLDIATNHGQPDFTCVYRVRVHGHPAD